MAVTPPTVRRLQLAHALKGLRLEANKKPEDVAEYLGCQTSKISRIELAQNNIGVSDVRALCQLYELSEERTEIMLELARSQKRRGRWTSYQHVYPQWLHMYLDLEESARTIQRVQSEIVPGLLQTEGYVRALAITGIPLADDTEDAEHRLLARKARQAILTRRNPPETSFIISESALRRQIGDSQVMREQLAHLATVAQLPNVQLQVLPFNANTHSPLIIYNFTLLDIEAPGNLFSDLKITYVENFDDGRYFDDRDVVAGYVNMWGRLSAAALGPVESRQLLVEAAEQLR